MWSLPSHIYFTPQGIEEEKLISSAAHLNKTKQNASLDNPTAELG